MNEILTTWPPWTFHIATNHHPRFKKESPQILELSKRMKSSVFQEGVLKCICYFIKKLADFSFLPPNYTLPYLCYYWIDRDIRMIRHLLSVYNKKDNSLKVFVIYERVVARKIRLTRRFSFSSFIEINKIKKRMKYLSRLTGGYLVGGKRLLWSGLTVLSGDALSDVCGFNCLCDLRLPWLYIPDFKHQLQKTLFVEKNDWLKIDLFL